MQHHHIVLVSLLCGSLCLGCSSSTETGQAQNGSSTNTQDSSSVEDRLSVLVEQLRSSERSISNEAYFELARLGPAAKPAIPHLADLLQPENRGFGNIVQLLIDLEAPVKDVMPQMLTAAQTAGFNQQRSIGHYFSQPHARFSDVATQFAPLVKDPDSNAFEMLVQRFADLKGSQAKSAIPWLLEAAKNSNADSKDHATILKAFESMGTVAEDVLPEFIVFFAFEANHNEAVSALSKIDPVGRSIPLPILVAALESNVRVDDKGDVIEAIGLRGVDALPYLPALKELEHEAERKVERLSREMEKSGKDEQILVFKNRTTQDVQEINVTRLSQGLAAKSGAAIQLAWKNKGYDLLEVKQRSSGKLHPSGLKAATRLENKIKSAVASLSVLETTGKSNDDVVGEPAWRVFSDATGSFSVEAVFIKFEAGMVTLEKHNGSQIQVPLTKFSEADKQWIEAFQNM